MSFGCGHPAGPGVSAAGARVVPHHRRQRCCGRIAGTTARAGDGDRCFSARGRRLNPVRHVRPPPVSSSNAARRFNASRRSISASRRIAASPARSQWGRRRARAATSSSSSRRSSVVVSATDSLRSGRVLMAAWPRNVTPAAGTVADSASSAVSGFRQPQRCSLRNSETVGAAVPHSPSTGGATLRLPPFVNLPDFASGHAASSRAFQESANATDESCASSNLPQLRARHRRPLRQEPDQRDRDMRVVSPLVGRGARGCARAVADHDVHAPRHHALRQARNPPR